MTHPPITGIGVFLAIVQEGSLRAAARSLGIGAPAVSHQLKALERKLGVDLLIRTTRSNELTEAGRILLKGTAPAFQEIVDALKDTSEIGKAKKGILRLTLPRSAYSIIIRPLIAEFQETYPDICLDISIDEGLVNVVQEGFHAGFRLGDRLNTDMVAIKLTPPLMPAFSASPSYLDLHGRPNHPQDLLKHKCVRYKLVSANSLHDWKFNVDGQEMIVDPPTKLIFNNIQLVTRAVLDGHGIGWSLRSVIEKQLASGELEIVLESYVTELPPFYLYYPEQNRRLELLRTFIDFLAQKQRKQLRHHGDALLAVSDLLAKP